MRSRGEEGRPGQERRRRVSHRVVRPRAVAQSGPWEMRGRSWGAEEPPRRTRGKLGICPVVGGSAGPLREYDIGTVMGRRPSGPLDQAALDSCPSLAISPSLSPCPCMTRCCPIRSCWPFPLSLLVC